MLIVLIGAALLTVQGIKEDISAKRQNLLQVEGQNIASINSALGSFITNNYALLIPAGFSQTTSTAITAPTLDQLSAQSNNKVAFKNGPFWGGAYQIALSVVPDNCSTAAGNCHIASQIYPSLPLISMKDKTADIAGAGVLAAAGGAQFGYSTNRTPATITGIHGQWSFPNPAGSKPGMVLAINGFGADGNSPYYRRDGALPLTGTMNANNQDMQNVGNVTLGANKVLKMVGGSVNPLQIGDGASYYGDPQNAAVRTKGAFYVQNYNGSGAAPINAGGGTFNGNTTVNGSGTVNGNATVNGYMQVVGNGVQGQACSPDAAIVRNAQTWSSLLLCSYGRWQPIGSANNNAAPGAACAPAGSFYTDVNNNGYVCNYEGYMTPLTQTLSNFATVYKTIVHDTYPWVSKPSCPGGTPVVDIVPQTTGVNVTAGPPYESVVYRMNDGGSYWVPQITLIQAGTGAGETGNDLGLTATAIVQCQYGNGAAPGY
ncbi:hypothetical protein [Caballeronia sp. LZ032]|uniref:hypothetical protein n=1 Tax=Caballeronia sp. LZ032 TaxID=3038565 RepID=UPI0028674BB3|nr:hypothetical protein [Caballeronia sp. LZ032]MDR5884114.1 hypothetical protein [Caballeronia sp. LZ032]